MRFSSTKESEIDFSKLAPVTLIVGEIEGHKGKSNGCGKSTIFDAICFVLFGQCRVTGSKNVTLDDLIRWGEDEASVEFDFIVDDGDGYFRNKESTGLFDSGNIFWVKYLVSFRGVDESINKFGGLVDIALLEPDLYNKKIVA